MSLLRESYQKSDLKRKDCHLSCFTFLSQLASILLSNSFFFSLSLSSTHVKSYLLFHLCIPPISNHVFFFFFFIFVFHSCQIMHLSNLTESRFFDQTSLSSLLGPSIDLELSDSASLYRSFLRISATYCINWTNRLFRKASPINGFGVFLPTTV